MISKDSNDGFEVFTLTNEFIQLKVVPELGMKIISLINIKTSREWMWSSSDARKLFKNNSSDAFAKSPLIGADECFPTIDKCNINEIEMGDHGLIWSNKCNYEIEDNSLISLLHLEELNMTFKRKITLTGSSIDFDYELENLSTNAQPYIWAFHPFIDIKDNDEWSYEGVWGNFLCTEVKDINGLSRGSNIKVEDLNGFQQMNIESGQKDDHFLKGFLTNDSKTYIEIKNNVDGNSLLFDLKNIPFTGIWLTRGGWKNYHHIVIEPTNACYENLKDVTASPEETTLLKSKEIRQWEFAITLSGN